MLFDPEKCNTALEKNCTNIVNDNFNHLLSNVKNKDDVPEELYLQNEDLVKEACTIYSRPLHNIHYMHQSVVF